MFRIKKVFENLSLAIYKIEGKITDESLQVWITEVKTLTQSPDRKLILDFCQVWSITGQAVELLSAYLADRAHDVHIMNPSLEVRNILHAGGLAMHVLE